jgi:hypothetical protein
MKKLILSTLMTGAVAVASYGQGTINVDNIANTDTTTGATSNGSVFIASGVNGAPVLLNGNINLTILGGSSAGSLTAITTILGNDAWSAGQFIDPNGSTYSVPGVALSGTATLEIELWTGSATTFAAATGPGVYTGSAIFTNPTGGGGIPAATPSDLVGMPSIVLTTPEPSTMVLGGLGAALLLFRRKK